MFLALLIAACTLLAVYIKWNFSYWQRKGYVYVEPKIPFGVLDSVRRRERSLGMAIYDVYKSTTDKVVGIYLIFRPALLVRDPQLARDVLAKDFQSFHDRGVYVDEKNDPMSAGIFFLKGQRWKTLRTKLTPTFTSGKLKAMFGTIEDVSEKLVQHLQTIVPAEGSAKIEMKKLMSTYAIDIVASAIFGLDVDSFKEPNNEFHNLSASINVPTFASVIRGTCQFLYPTLEKIFVRFGWQELAQESMRKIVHRTVEYREKNNVSRKDMLQLLLQLRNTGKINDNDDVWSAESSADALKSMSIDMIAAQLFIFYVAGYETSAATAAFTMYELAQYPDLLQKAQKDVENALAKHGRLTYDTIHDMKFLDLCIMETIRKYPGLPILNRECTHDYPIPGTDKVIEKGTPIVISLFGMQRDPEYFPDPMRYDPERFMEENMNYNPVAYMPFGEGPRHCIAQRMGKVNVKVALAQILTYFNIEHNKEYKEIEIDTFGIPIMAKGGINVRLSRKKDAPSMRAG